MINEVKVRFSSDGEEVTFFEVVTVSRDYLNKCLVVYHENGFKTQIPADKYDYIELGSDVEIIGMLV